MKVYKGASASPGLVLGQVSRLEHHVETATAGPFNPARELRLLTDAIHTAQSELESMADRAAPTEQAIFQFQSMMLDDEGMMNEVRFCINAGIGAAAAMNQVGQRYADQLANMKDNPYISCAAWIFWMPPAGSSISSPTAPACGWRWTTR